MKKGEKRVITIPLPAAIAFLALLATCVLGLVTGIAILVLRQPPAAISPMPTQGPTPTPYTQQFEGGGGGSQLEEFAVLRDGAVYFGAIHGGEGIFIVEVKDAAGQHVTFVAGCTNECRDESVQNMAAGTYYLEVTARAPWFVVVVQ